MYPNLQSHFALSRSHQLLVDSPRILPAVVAHGPVGKMRERNSAAAHCASDTGYAFLGSSDDSHAQQFERRFAGPAFEGGSAKRFVCAEGMAFAELVVHHVDQLDGAWTAYVVPLLGRLEQPGDAEQPSSPRSAGHSDGMAHANW